MALTQMQQIQSLGEALAWLERELNWGVKPATLSHLCGRICWKHAGINATMTEHSKCAARRRRHENSLHAPYF
jgi:hypothetical protein